MTGACVGHLETDGVDHYLHVTEKRNRKRRKILLDAARPVLAYVDRAGIAEDRKARFSADDARRERLIRALDRKTPWRLVKKYCQAAGIDPDRLGGRGIGIDSLSKTAINDAIRNGATITRRADPPATATSAPPRCISWEGRGRRGGRPSDSDPSDGPPR